MELTSDIILKGNAWNVAIENLEEIFVTRTNYMIYMISLSIGILYDKRIEKLDQHGSDEFRYVPRNVIQNNDCGKLDFMFQTAILSTTTGDFTEEERLELAFGERTDFKKIEFLTQFANFGVTKLIEQIDKTPIATMEKIKNFLFVSADCTNPEISFFSDDILAEDNI